MAPETVDRSYPLFGKVPLPPVMIQQLDMILTLGLLQPLRKKVLEDFQKIVLANKPRSWLTIYLCTFMFLHSCAALSAENYANARKHGLRVFSSPSSLWPKNFVLDSFLTSHFPATILYAYIHLRATSWSQRILITLPLLHTTL